MIVFLNVNFNCIKFLIAFWACRRYQKPGKQDKTSTPSGCSLQSLRPQRFRKALGSQRIFAAIPHAGEFEV